MEKLNFKQFEKASLPNNQLRSIFGGKETSWTQSDGKAGTDTTSGKSHTKFSDETESDKDGKIM